MNRESVIELLALLDAAQLRQTPDMDDVLVSLWVSNLRDVSADAALEAVRRIIREEEFFPQIAHVWRAANTLQRAEKQRALPAQGGGYRCSKCEDTSVVVIDLDEHVSAYPCPRCNQEAFARWEAGEYRPKVFRAVLAPVDGDAARAQLERVRVVLAKSQEGAA